MKIAYFTPLNPQQSGISDFAEELLPSLSHYARIDLFTDGIIPDNLAIQTAFRVYDIKDYDNAALRSTYDMAVFQVGNNYMGHRRIVDSFLKHGGILELHDVSLHHFLASLTLANDHKELYERIIKYCHGRKGLEAAQEFFDGKAGSLWENRAIEFPVNRYLIDRADAVIVHSDFARQMIISINPLVPTICIPLGTSDIIMDHRRFRNECRSDIQIDEDLLVFGSFGFATPTKRIIQILEALALYMQNISDRFVYYIVGSVADPTILTAINRLHLGSHVVITNYVTLEKFKMYMGACDICLNLRYPTQGESSAALHRMLGMGKPSLVTDVGSFSEYPDDVVYKIPYDENEVQNIYKAICDWTVNDEEILKRADSALKYAGENFDIEKLAKDYFHFFSDFQDSTFSPNLDDILVSRLTQAVGCDAERLEEVSIRVEAAIQHIYDKSDYEGLVCIPRAISNNLASRLVELDIIENEYIEHLTERCSYACIDHNGSRHTCESLYPIQMHCHNDINVVK